MKPSSSSSSAFAVVALCLSVAVTNAFVTPGRAILSLQSSRSTSSSSRNQASEVEAEASAAVNGDSTAPGRYDDVLKAVGLDGKLNHVSQLPDKRKMSAFNIFCNRELNLGSIAAIGFDMDYTLAQYQQPAFDKLAFDGAKEKLVRKLGYPEEVLDFEYDHEVSYFYCIKNFPSIRLKIDPFHPVYVALDSWTHY
jgi:hypothetical protein